VAALQKTGFELDRIRGSHHVMRHDGPPVRAVSVPVHGNRPLPRGTLKAIIEQSGLELEEFIALL
jgi:predicted RNA binding protein YcfA (HicA-like mRNA interferase family)